MHIYSVIHHEHHTINAGRDNSFEQCIDQPIGDFTRESDAFALCASLNQFSSDEAGEFEVLYMEYTL